MKSLLTLGACRIQEESTATMEMDPFFRSFLLNSPPVIRLE